MERLKYSSLLKLLPTKCPYGTLGHRIIKYKMMFCVPAERIVGRKMIRIEKRSVGTHGVIFPKLMIESICTKRSDGTFKTFVIIDATHDMSLRDIAI